MHKVFKLGQYSTPKMGDFLKGSDFLYIGLGLGALYLIMKNTKTLSRTVTGATSVVNPLLAAAGRGAKIVTDPNTYQTYTGALLDAPFTTAQAWRLFKKEPGLATGINATLTSLGLFK